jgi:hypothetical protein
MLGWFLDIIAEYVFRVILRSANLIRTYRWPDQNAKVLIAECPDYVLGCALVKINYEYSVEGKKYDGSYNKPFMVRDYAKIYATELCKRGNIDVRVNPKDPSQSIFIRY